MRTGQAGLKPLASAVHLEIAIAEAEDEFAEIDPREGPSDRLFALRIRRWGLGDDDLAHLLPVRDPRLRILTFDYDISDFREARTAAELPPEPMREPSYVIAFAGERGARDPLLVDRMTARILELSDGTRTATEIFQQLRHERSSSRAEDTFAWIENSCRHRVIVLGRPK